MSSAGTIYAATDGGVSISTNSGTSFTTRTLANSGLVSNTVLGIYTYAGTIYAATSGGLSISSDSGTSWTNYTTANGLGSNMVKSVYADADGIYAGTEGGVSIAAVPEPSTYAMALAGLACGGYSLFRRRKRA